VREVAEHVEEKRGKADVPENGQPGTARAAAETSVLCIAGRTELDGAAAEMLAQVLAERAIAARVLPPIAISEGALNQLDLKGVKVVCLSYFHPQPQVFARYICRRLRRHAPMVRLIVCCWNAPPHAGHTDDLARQMSADAAVVSIETCAKQVEAWASRQPSAAQPAGAPEHEYERLEALRELGLNSAARARFDAATKRVAQAFDAPIALVSLIDDGQPVLPNVAGSPSNPQAAQSEPRETSICGHVMASDETVVAEDVTKDARFADNPLVLEKGIRFYAGAPLRTSAGLTLGSLCVIDTKPRSFSDAERRRLQEMAQELMTEIEAAGPRSAEEIQAP
jgi:GAF domain-containing protein